MPELVVIVGEYTVLLLPGGELKALRHNKEWRDVTGDNLILALAMEVERLREQIRVLEIPINNMIYGD